MSEWFQLLYNRLDFIFIKKRMQMCEAKLWIS